MTKRAEMDLRTLDRSVRALLTAFLITVAIGYAAGLYFVSHTTGATPGGTIEQFRGNDDVPIEEVDEIKYAKDTLEMMNIIHTHVTSFALIYLAVGGVFLFSGFDPRLKVILAVEPFIATILLFGGMAGLRYLAQTTSGIMSWLMMVAGVVTTLCFFVMVMLSLFDMWIRRENVSDAA